MRNSILLGCLVVSGFTGLAYELLWVRMLALSFGSTTLSFSTVLAVFFGGLSLGAWLAGRWVHRVERPARAYAVLEFTIGGSALVLYPLLLNLGDLFARFDPGDGLMGALARAAVSVPLLLVPTLLMGATLPIVVRGVIAKDGQVGKASGLIYAFNTFGAFAGVYGTTYWLLPHLGVFGSTLFAVALNVVVGVVAWLADPGPQTARVEVDPEAPAAEGAPAKERRVGVAMAALMGFSAICFQVVWVRLVSIFLLGTVYGVGSVLICTLFGIALGSLIVAPLLQGRKNIGVWLAWMQVIIAGTTVLLTWQLELFAYVLMALGENLKGLSLMHAHLLVVTAALVVPTIASGASLPLLVQALEARAEAAPRTFANLYTSNTVGSILGSVLTGFVLIPLAGTVATLYLGVLISGTTGAICALIYRGRATWSAGLAGAAALLAAFSFTGYDAQRVSQASRNTATGQSYASFLKRIDAASESTVFFSEGKVSTVTVHGEGGRRALLLSGLGQGGWSDLPPHHIFESFMVAYVPFVYRGEVDDALVVGLGAGATADALLELGVGHLDVIELEGGVVEGLGQVFGDATTPLQNPRADIHVGDARHFLKRALYRRERGYDLITSMPAHPWVASSIFTVEFFELARDSLAEDGVFSTWFGVDQLTGGTVDSLLRGFKEAFPHHAIHWVPRTSALYMVGSKQPLTLDLARLEHFAEMPTVRVQPPAVRPLPFAASLVSLGPRERINVASGPVNSDDSAYVEVFAPRSSTSTTSSFKPAEIGSVDLARVNGGPDLAPSLIEQALGTPDGHIAWGARTRPSVRSAEVFLEQFAAELSEAAKTYFEGRVLLAKGKREESRKLLRTVKAEPWSTRARRFIPVTFEVDTPERRAAYAAAPRDLGVLARWYDEFPDDVRELTTVTSSAVEGSVESFVLAALLGQDTSAFSEDTVIEAASELGDSSMRRLVRRVAEVLESREGLQTVQAVLLARADGLDAGYAKGLAARARRAGKERDYAEALELFTRSSKVRPLGRKDQELWIVAVVEAGTTADRARVEAALSSMGWKPETIEVAFRRAEAGAAKAAAEPPGG